MIQIFYSFVKSYSDYGVSIVIIEFIFLFFCFCKDINSCYNRERMMIGYHILNLYLIDLMSNKIMIKYEMKFNGCYHALKHEE